MPGRTWHGVDRGLLSWYPIIDYDKCDGCGLCLLTCGNNVFRWRAEDDRPVVANEGNCVFGCTTCGKLCPEEAIGFPGDPKESVERAAIEHRIFPRVREELRSRLEKFPGLVVDEETGPSGEVKPADEFATWHGMERSSIEWGPTIDPERCVGCGLCVVTCGERRNVFGYDQRRHKAVVLNPDNCMVGCDNCRVACLWGAISFPDAGALRELVRTMGDAKFKEELSGRLITSALAYPNDKGSLTPSTAASERGQIVGQQRS